MKYFRCGKSGLKLPAVSLGLWHNFGSKDNFDNMKELIFTAFDNGITHFDLANNYGPVYGSAEDNFGRIMDSDMRPGRRRRKSWEQEKFCLPVWIVMVQKPDMICGRGLTGTEEAENT